MYRHNLSTTIAKLRFFPTKTIIRITCIFPIAWLFTFFVGFTHSLSYHLKQYLSFFPDFIKPPSILDVFFEDISRPRDSQSQWKAYSDIQTFLSLMCRQRACIHCSHVVSRFQSFLLVGLIYYQPLRKTY